MEQNTITLEYVLGNVSKRSLWRQLSTTIGLSAWLAYKVELQEPEATLLLSWNEHAFDVAQVVEQTEEERIVYDIQSQDGDEYRIGFSILEQELTGDRILRIDESFSEEHPDDLQLFWDDKIALLKISLGV